VFRHTFATCGQVEDYPQKWQSSQFRPVVTTWMGREELVALPLDPWASLRRAELLQLLDQLSPWIC
jgi:hypothetical protein